ncbi:AI-2E family transporter [Jiella sp. M17.18]|uniref:AI-2E family transporter n=1 Tax=Jiella sp. M17.18 TaxID=3234247 RepID=UPI0034DE22C0
MRAKGHPPLKHVRRIPPGGALAVVVIIGLFLYAVQLVLLPFVISIAVAYAATPGVDWMTARTGWPRAAPAMIVFFLIVGLMALVGWLGAPGLISEGQAFLTDVQGTIERAISGFVGNGKIELLGLDMNAHQLSVQAAQAVRDWATQIGRVMSIATIGVSAIFGFFLTLVLLAYFLIGLPSVGRGLLKMVPPAQRPTVAYVWSEIHPVLSRYFMGLGIVVAYASVAAYLGLGIGLGLPHAVLLSILTGFLELIPVVGPGASAVLAGLVALQHATSFWAIGAYIIYAAALRISIDQFVGPIVLGRAARIPPVLVIFCFLAGGLLFSIPGVILAVPAALTIRVVAATLYGEENETPMTENDDHDSDAHDSGKESE